mmetsp:Transcript_3225/g.9834  ORF Transcript_3225/g.9834 Transcript_3225/m.9834 type:complete len:394 (-) Transcript_3225:143-1324(-)|eukprot:CAMPEP_0198730874 /NCGR_PEP_ID=MMETSP1475-20131203/26793_1 /TAXON_ID= ORGANISM="Unidentified sp., Strain CCMP1999" /NCGR_SAMPLE_ID=MMETSP1475 /ASSEMBLY_ACC=CAM_ASM_001111 /LENGTH=393 /DNA_ID=CAMNT_0044493743 /DNA_START=446 /DNA_END=1627 /DNA_ORIENTATION=+
MKTCRTPAAAAAGSLLLLLLLSVASAQTDPTTCTYWNTLAEIDVPDCPATEEFDLKITRPNCECECHDFHEGALTIYNELQNAAECDTTRTESEKDVYYRCTRFMEFVTQNTCKRYVNGQAKLCMDSVLAIRLYNEMLSQCKPELPTAPEISGPEILACAPQHTLPFVESDTLAPDLQDGVLEDSTLETVPLQQLTGTQRSQLNTFYTDMIDLALKRDALLWERSIRMHDIAYDLWTRSQNSTESHAATLTSKGNYYMQLSTKSAEQAGVWAARAEMYQNKRTSLHDTFPSHDFSARVALEEHSERQVLTCVDRETNLACDDHYYEANIDVNDSCVSCCMWRMCHGAFSKVYCLKESIKEGWTMPTCTASVFTRYLCFNDIYQEYFGISVLGL